MTQSVEVKTDPINCKLKITLKQDGLSVGSIDIETHKAARLAAMILNSAALCFRESGKPNPPADAPHTKIATVAPSGHTVGQGPTSPAAPIFYFGDAILGIELDNETAQVLGQQLVTISANQTTRQ